MTETLNQVDVFPRGRTARDCFRMLRLKKAFVEENKWLKTNGYIQKYKRNYGYDELESAACRKVICGMARDVLDKICQRAEITDLVLSIEKVRGWHSFRVEFDLSILRSANTVQSHATRRALNELQVFFEASAYAGNRYFGQNTWSTLCYTEINIGNLRLLGGDQSLAELETFLSRYFALLKAVARTLVARVEITIPVVAPLPPAIQELETIDGRRPDPHRLTPVGRFTRPLL